MFGRMRRWFGKAKPSPLTPTGLDREDLHSYSPDHYRRRRYYTSQPLASVQQNSGDGFLTGLLIGEALAGHAGSESAPYPIQSQPPSFDTSFSGGESGGAGGGADWSPSPDPPSSCDTSSSSYDSSSSSFDSSPSCDSGSSFDSGSSGGGFDSGSGGF